MDNTRAARHKLKKGMVITMKRIIFLLLLVSGILLCACSMSGEIVVENTDIPELGVFVDIEEYIGENLEDYASEKVVIYRLRENDLQGLLKDPGVEFLNENCLEQNTYSLNQNKYIKMDGNHFYIYPSLRSFIGDESALQECLVDYGIKSKIENVVLVEIPEVPMLMLVETSDAPAYFLFSPYASKEGYYFVLYNNDNFNEKYRVKEGELIVNGKKIETKNPPLFYYNHIELPFSRVLEAMGYEFDWISESTAYVTIDGEKFKLDISEVLFCRAENENDNLLHRIVGGRYWVQHIDGEIMLDTHVMRTVFQIIDKDISYNTDRANAVISING